MSSRTMGSTSTINPNRNVPALAMLSTLVVYALLQLSLDPSSPPRLTSVAEDSLIHNTPTQAKRPLGREIVERAFAETYQHLVDSCGDDRKLIKCMRRMHNNGTTSFPWWFETMLRDGADPPRGLQGPWHRNVLTTTTHKIEFCNIEKTASSEWKILQCRLENKTDQGNCQGGQSTPEDPRAVFLRDPLERFLSGFVDKCINAKKRDKEAHCEPNEIFAPGDDPERRYRARNNITLPIIQELETSKQVFFDAYVDTLPLKWNVHFYPSSLYCDGLYRHVQDYDFVGHMGPDFHDNLRAFGQKYNMLAQVEHVFNLAPQEDTNDELMIQRNYRFALNRTGSSSKRIREYYTPRTLRRALEYLSIDYATAGLNLPIPDWVEEMLQEEVRGGRSPRAVA